MHLDDPHNPHPPQPLALLVRLQRDLEQRGAGWWERLVEEIPELADLEVTPQSPRFHAEGNVGIHTRMAVEACPQDGDPDLVWIALLHDIGKPQTTEHRGGEKITAYGHDRVGADLAERILARLGMPESRRERIVWAVRHHMFHLSWQLKSPGALTSRQREHLRHPDFPLLLEFLRVDALASKGGTSKLDAYRFYRELWQQQTGLVL